MMAHQLQYELNGGTSPDGVLANNFRYAGGIKPDIANGVPAFGFATIKEKPRPYLAQPYATSTATLNGGLPLPPKGVLDFTDMHGTDEITWQPTKNIRIAMVSVTYHYGDIRGYVIVGQSLRPYEHRIGIYTAIAVIAWAAMVAWASLWLLTKSFKTK